MKTIKKLTEEAKKLRVKMDNTSDRKSTIPLLNQFRIKLAELELLSDVVKLIDNIQLKDAEDCKCSGCAVSQEIKDSISR